LFNIISPIDYRRYVPPKWHSIVNEYIFAVKLNRVIFTFVYMRC
jgi:hypothetical protein